MSKAEIERGRSSGARPEGRVEVPGDREVGVAVNRGVPVPMSAPRSGVTKVWPRWPRRSSRASRAGRRGQADRADVKAPRRLRHEAPQGGVSVSLQCRIQSTAAEKSRSRSRRSDSARSVGRDRLTDPFAELKSRVHHEVITRLGPRLFANAAAATTASWPSACGESVDGGHRRRQDAADAPGARPGSPSRSPTTSSATARSSPSCATRP